MTNSTTEASNMEQERKQFEEWYCEKYSIDPNMLPYAKMVNNYMDVTANLMWESWQARAAQAPNNDWQEKYEKLKGFVKGKWSDDCSECAAIANKLINEGVINESV